MHIIQPKYIFVAVVQVYSSFSMVYKSLNARTDFHNDFYHCNKYIYIIALDDTLRYKVYKKSSFFIKITI